MCAKDLHAPWGAHYLIVLRECVVLQDISDTIVEFDPGAMVISVTAPEEALAAIAEVERLAVVFVEAAPHAFVKTDLAAAIASRGGRIVFLGDAAEDGSDAGRWIVLRRPFSSETVLGHLAALTSE